MKSPDKCTIDELKPYASEYSRRLRLGKTARAKVVRVCPKCGGQFGARELRAHIPKCHTQYA